MSKQKFSQLNRNNIVDFLADIFNRRGADIYLGEAVTTSEHMLQCALLAEQAGASDELIAGALLHDIGHFTSEFPENALEEGINNYHDTAGAAVLVSFFPKLVTACVGNHVAAKRYLCATDVSYFDRLSLASVDSLELQGGPMNAAEVTLFQQNPHLQDILQVRIWDESAKVANKSTPPFAHYAPLLQRLVDSA